MYQLENHGYNVALFTSGSNSNGLAESYDNHDAIRMQEEDRLAATITEMERAKHHVELNQKLEGCFDILDSIIKNFRHLNEEY